MEKEWKNLCLRGDLMKIGIDLGTTYSAAAYIKDGKPQPIENSEGEKTTPSVVLFEDDGSVTVGSDAKERALIEPENTVSTIKNHMGTQTEIVIRGNKYKPEDISSMILKKVVQDSRAALGEQIDGAVVTIPAYFSDAQRKATQDACELAGIRLLGMINEPTAAALCYMQDKNPEDVSTIMVYDLGGGTFDVSIVRLDKNGAEVIATQGIKETGGHFFDQKIREYVVDMILEKYDIDLTEDEYKDIFQEITTKAENCKVKLSSTSSTNIVLRIGTIKEKITITREDFEKMILKNYKRTESMMKRALEDGGLSWSDIDEILLVGGSSRIPLIREQIRQLSGIEPSTAVNPDEAVCYGAALYANSIDDFKLKDVCSHSIGLAIFDQNAKKVNSVVIKRNTPLPAREERTFFVPSDNVNIIMLELTEGEGRDLDYVNLFSSVEIPIEGNVKAGTPVHLGLNLDENQILHVSVRIEGETEIEEELSIDRKGNLTKREMQKKKSILTAMNIN